MYGITVPHKTIRWLLSLQEGSTENKSSTHTINEIESTTTYQACSILTIKWEQYPNGIEAFLSQPRVRKKVGQVRS